MQTRITFREHKTAQAALQALVSHKLNSNGGKKLNGEEPLLSFADFCLQAATDHHAEKPVHAELLELQQKLGSAITRAAETRSCQKPAWAAKLEAVVHFSERVLGMAPPRAIRGTPDPRTIVHRKRSLPCGTYSTPDFIVDDMCRDLLAALSKVRAAWVNIADLSLEVGHFPLGLLACPSPLKICFYGMDRDESALRTAERILQFALESADKRNFQLITAQNDSTLGTFPPHWPGQFDAVIGNPPWKTRHSTDTHQLRNAYSPYLSGQFDVYLAFMLRAHQLLRPGGFLSMVVPSAFLFNQNAAPVRELFLRHYRIIRLSIYPRRSFIEIPCVIPVSFLAQKSEGATKRLTTISYHPSSLGGLHRPRFGTRRAAAWVWSRLPDRVFNPFARKEMLFLLSIGGNRRLSDYGVLACGAQFGRETPTASPISFLGFNGKDLRPFHSCRRHAVLYRAGYKDFARTPPIRYVATAKVLFQKTRCMTLPARLVAALAGEGTLATSAASMFVPREVEHVGFFEALLNSDLANAWYKLREVNRSITLSVLADLPVVFDPAVWKNIRALGRELAEIREYFHRQSQSCTVAQEHEVFSEHFPRMWAKMVRIKNEMDSSIFGLYQLKREQRQIASELSRARVF